MWKVAPWSGRLIMQSAMFKRFWHYWWCILFFSVTSCALPANELAHVRLSTVDGVPLPPNALRGKVVILDFWASWCGPCVRIMPQLQRFYNRYQRHPKVVFLAINNSETPEEAMAFLQRLNIRYPTYFDNTRHTSAHFRVVGLPTTVILSTKGEIAFIHRGFNPNDDVVALLTREVEALLTP